MKAGWEVRPLGEVFNLIGGGTPSKKGKDYYGGPIPWITVRDMNVETVVTTDHTITEVGLENSSSKIIPAGEIIIASRVGLGKVCKLSADMAINQDLKGVVPKKSNAIDRQFLFYWFQSIATHIEDNGVGATVQGVKLTFLNNLEFPVVPLEEQKQIVAVLDAAFERLTRAKENAEANLQNARELFDNSVEGHFRELSERNKPKPLLDVCRERGITYGVIKLGDQIDDGVPCLRTSNVRSLAFTLEGMKSISMKLSNEYSRTILRGGEVLVNVRGTLGGVTVVPSAMSGWNISREVAMVDVNYQEAIPDYVALFIASKTAQNWLTGVTTGAAYKGINLTDLRKLPMPLPDKHQQIGSINILNAIKDRIVSTEANYTTKLTDIADLRQSLLQKAFAGELT